MYDKKYSLTLKSIIFSALFQASTAFAAPIDDFAVDLDAPIPDITALEREIYTATDRYNPNYDFSWNMGIVFKGKMSNMISAFGGSEKRLKSDNEDVLYSMITSLPKELYPYIGPQLHASLGISEKIRNIPGIKETKNQFPKIIAPQVADIEDLEFLSPQLYFLLIPQMWPSNTDTVETPQKQKRQVETIKSGYDPEFFARLFKEVPPENFIGAEPKKNIPIKDRLRDLSPTPTSPLSGADVRAFAQTLPAIRAFTTNEMFMKIDSAGMLLDYWEAKNGKALSMNGLKDMVNPCQRLALKIKWAGVETQFLRAIAPQAFDLKSWAYTCDKTIKAYRISRMPLAQVQALRAFKSPLIELEVPTASAAWREQQRQIMDATIEMYTAPKEDVHRVMENKAELTKNIVPFRRHLIGAPIYY